MKEIYSFKIKDGEKFKRVFLKKLTRSERDEVQKKFASIRFQAMKNGMASVAMMNKLYEDEANGVLSKKQEEEYVSLKLKMKDLQEKLVEIGTKKVKKETKEKQNAEVLKELEDIQRKLTDFETEKNSIYEGTADYYARNKVIEHIMLNNVYVSDHLGDGEFAEAEKFFKGENPDEQFEYFEELDESGGYTKSLELCTLICMFYWMGHGKDQETMNELISISGYLDYVQNNEADFEESLKKDEKKAKDEKTE